MERILDDGVDFTERAYDSMYDVVDDVNFRDHDAELIYKALASRLKAIPFCNYLKRYYFSLPPAADQFDCSSNLIFPDFSVRG